MNQFLIEKFGPQGEKTGWTYVRIPAEVCVQLNPGVRVSFRVKGFLDQVPIEKTSVLPMGDGDFILPLNATLRRKLRKKAGDLLFVNLRADQTEYQLNQLMMDCLQEEPVALERFLAFPPSHQRYFSKWVDAAKSEHTVAKRIARILQAMHLSQNYAEMIRSHKDEK